MRSYPRFDPKEMGHPLHELLAEDVLKELRSTLVQNPTIEDCIGCGGCCKDYPCGGGYDVKDLDGQKTCDKLVEVDRVNGQPQYRCFVFASMIKDPFARMCLEPGRGCDKAGGTKIGMYPDRLALLQGLQERAGLEAEQSII